MSREGYTMISNKSHQKKKDLLFYILLLAWPITQFCIFYIGVNFNSVLMAFQDYDIATGKSTIVWFENFRELFYNLAHDPLYITAIKNSLNIWGIGLFVSMPIGLSFSYYIYKKRPLGGFFHVILFIPSIISSMVLALMYQYFTDLYVPNIINKVFDVQMEGLFTNLDTIFPAVILYGVWFGFGTSTLLYLGAMKGISESVIEAAKIDGANVWQEFFHIIIPQVFSTITVFIVMGIAGIFVNQGALFEFFGQNVENQNYTIGYFLFVRAYTTESMHNYLAAMGLVITLIIAPICIGLRKLFQKIDPMN